MTKDEALAFDLAQEALKLSSVTVDSFGVQRKIQEAITAIKQARALDKMAENARELGLDYEPVPENFIDALKFDVAMRDAAPVQEDWGPGPHECHSLTAAPVQEPVIDHSCKDTYELIMKWADIYAAQTGNLYAQAAQDPSKVARMADERTMLACVVAQAISQPSALVQEPVAFFDPQGKGFYWAKPTKIAAPVTVDVEPLPLYTTPPVAPVQDELAYREAVSLATWLFKKHFAHEEHYASGRVVWEPCDTTAGVISQIDNMVCGLVQPAATVKESLTVQPAAQRPWVGLTDEDVYPLANEHLHYQPESYEVSGIYNLARAIEAKLKEKNT